MSCPTRPGPDWAGLGRTGPDWVDTAECVGLATCPCRVGADGVRVSEVVDIDIDFGVVERRGHQRIIPNDFGSPTDITAESPDANAQLDVGVIGIDETFETQRFEVVLTGFDFDSIERSSGARAALGGCSFERGKPTIWSR